MCVCVFSLRKAGCWIILPQINFLSGLLGWLGRHSALGQCWNYERINHCASHDLGTNHLRRLEPPSPTVNSPPRSPTKGAPQWPRISSLNFCLTGRPDVNPPFFTQVSSCPRFPGRTEASHTHTAETDSQILVLSLFDVRACTNSTCQLRKVSHEWLNGWSHEPLQSVTLNTPWRECRAESRNETIYALGKLAEQDFRQDMSRRKFYEPNFSHLFILRKALNSLRDHLLLVTSSNLLPRRGLNCMYLLRQVIYMLTPHPPPPFRSSSSELSKMLLCFSSQEVPNKSELIAPMVCVLF